MKHNPPPKFRGQNADRGYTQPPKKEKEVPRQQPRTFNEINPDTNKPYIRTYIPD